MAGEERVVRLPARHQRDERDTAGTAVVIGASIVAVRIVSVTVGVGGGGTCSVAIVVGVIRAALVAARSGRCCAARASRPNPRAGFAVLNSQKVRLRNVSAMLPTIVDSHRNGEEGPRQFLLRLRWRHEAKVRCWGLNAKLRRGQSAGNCGRRR